MGGNRALNVLCVHKANLVENSRLVDASRNCVPCVSADLGYATLEEVNGVAESIFGLWEMDI